MKYNDYPENLPDVLIEKLNSEYTRQLARSLQDNQPTPERPTTQPVAPPPSPPTAPTPPDIIPPAQTPTNDVSILQPLTDAEIGRLASTITNQLEQLIFYLNEYAKRTSNAGVRQSVQNISCCLSQVRDSFLESFEITTTPCQPTHFSNSSNRKWLRERILHLFYCVLSNMIILYAQQPDAFGVQNTLSTVLDGFYSFLTLPQIT